MLFAQKQRREIISKIIGTMKLAKKNGLVISENKLISEICINYGSTKRKAKEYIDNLIELEEIKRTDEGLVYNG